jgi:hypothetical protein
LLEGFREEESHSHKPQVPERLQKGMKLTRALIFGFFSLLLIFTDSSVALAGAWNLPLAAEIKEGEELVAVEEGVILTRSTRQVNFDVKSSGVFQGRVCNVEYDSGDCDLNDPKLDFWGRALMGVCESTLDTNCIEGFGLSTSKGALVKGRYLRSVDTPHYAAIEGKSLPAFKSTPLFSVDGFAHKGGATTYAPIVETTFKWDSTKKVFYASAFQANVIPYKEITDTKFISPIFENVRSGDRETVLYSGVGENCAWVEKSKCGVPEDFGDDVRVHLQVRLSNEIVGWFRGRLTNPSIAISSANATSNSISIVGEPVTVSRFGAIATKENTTTEEQSLIAGMGGNPGSSIFSGRGRRYVFAHWGNFAWLETFRDIAKDTALGSSRVWNVSSIARISENSCLSDKSRLLGIVTTNATLYDGKVPDFVDGELRYQVSGMHFLPDGKTLSSGTYDLVMRSDTARCLYKFSSAPISANISVISATGSSQVATTLSGERDGWLYLSAANFTFSSPTIKVKLIQPTPAVTSSVTDNQSTRTKKTITCIKGVSKKKITSVDPKCPKGYKKA